jgi:hypothetical protein
MIHRFYLDSTLPEKDLFDAFKEGGYPTGIHILITISLHSSQKKSSIVVFIGTIKLHCSTEAC